MDAVKLRRFAEVCFKIGGLHEMQYEREGTKQWEKIKFNVQPLKIERARLFKELTGQQYSDPL